jgi:hypothetical protein
MTLSAAEFRCLCTSAYLLSQSSSELELVEDRLLEVGLGVEAGVVTIALLSADASVGLG